MSDTQYNQVSSILLKSVNWLCKPLIRLLISNGITYPQFREMVKALYVDVAQQDLHDSDKTVSDSRLFILTGVHRKDIKRLRQTNVDENTSLQTVSLGGTIVARWLGTKEYLDKNGEPRGLSRNDKNGIVGFDTLVSRISKDIRPRAILDEWLHSGIVSINHKNEICLNQKAFVPSKNFNEQSFYLARNVHDHLAACAHNMQSNQQPMLERSVYYSSLTSQSVSQLRELAHQEGIALLQKINQLALSLQQQDKEQLDANQRMRFGCYWYDEKNQKTPQQDGKKK